MARLIVKSPYISGKKSRPDGYMKYIATRPRVEGQGSHGLFGDEDTVDLQKAMTELSEYPGNI